MRSTRSLWNSPVVLAYLLWEFACGYRKKAESGAPLVWAFPALAILSQRQLSDAIHERCESLAQYVGRSLDRTQQLGYLRDIGRKISTERNTYCEAIALAYSYELITIDFQAGTINPAPINAADKESTKAVRFREKAGRKARTLGRLFAREKDKPALVCKLLGVYFK